MPRLNTVAEAFDAITAAGYYGDATGGTPGSTTTDAAASAGADTLSVVSETNFAADDYLRIGSGENLEAHQVESVAAGSIVLKTPIVNDQPSGAAVVEQDSVDMGHVAEGGATFDVSEDIFELVASTSAVVLTTKTVRTSFNITWPGLLWSMENIAVAFGIPETEVTGAGTAADPFQIGLIGDKFNTLKNTTLWFTGVRDDGTNIEVRGFNARYDLNKSASFARNAATELPTGGQVKAITVLQWL